MSMKDICFIKTLLVKPQWEENPSEGKKVQYSLCLNCVSKNLTRKTQWDKTMVKGKIVQNIFVSPPLIKTIIYEVKR
jgi:hypothetical protein